ncbi:rhamnulokinase [Petrotoga olearia]|nr:rhamnulokinase family protein [Petrotoga olearia]
MIILKYLHLAIDLGASGGKVMAGNIHNDKLILSEVNRFSNSPVEINGISYWNILNLYNHIIDSIQIAQKNDQKILSLGIDSWGVDFGLLNENGYLINNPIHYRNMFKTNTMQEAIEKAGKKWIYEHSPTQFQPFNTLYQILAYQKYAPDFVKISKDLLMIPSLLNYFLTGKKAIDFTMATTTQIYNHRKRKWDDEIMKKFDIPDILPEIVPAGTKIGKIKIDVLNNNSNIDVILPASHDTGSAYAAIASDPSDTMFISLGTWCLTGAIVNEVPYNEELMENNLAAEGCLDGSFRILANVTGMWLIQGIIKSLNLPDNSDTYQKITEMAQNAKPFSSYINVDDPSLQNPQDMIQAIIQQSIKDNDTVLNETSQVIRTALEGIAFKVNEVKEKLSKILEIEFKRIHVVGGGTRNELLCQFIADATGLTVLTGPIEGTAVGNLVSQLYALELVKNFEEARDLIKRSFEFQCFKPKEHDIWKEAFISFQKKK